MDGAGRTDNPRSTLRWLFIILIFLSKDLQPETSFASFFGCRCCASALTATCHTPTQDVALPGSILFAVCSGRVGMAGRYACPKDRPAIPAGENPFICHL